VRQIKSTPQEFVLGEVARIKARLIDIVQEMRALSEGNDFGDEVQKRFNALSDEGAKLRLNLQVARIEEQEVHDTKIERVRNRARTPGNVERGTLEFIDGDPIGEPRSIQRFTTGPWKDEGIPSWNQSSTDLRSRALDAIERCSGASDATREALTTTLERFDNKKGDLARQVIATTDPDYVSAFGELIRGETVLTPEETRAVRKVRDLQRAMSLTDNAGGYLVPAQLDPSVIITGAGSQNAIRQIARKVVANSDTWTGVSAGQISASWDAEASEVSDDSPTLAQPSISIHTDRVFIPFSLEVGMDAQGNFTEELVKMMVDAKENLENDAFTTGSGTGQPYGIITALVGGASVVTSAAADTFASADVYTTYEGVPPRWRGKASWLANELIFDKIRQFGTSDGHALWARFGDALPERLLGSPRYNASNMDGVINAGAENYALLYGDFNQYVIADRIGFTVEPIPHLFGTNKRPTGQRGLFGYSRVGADSVVDDAFRLLNVT
jgi:HK97 family phage major capsid protein